MFVSLGIRSVRSSRAASWHSMFLFVLLSVLVVVLARFVLIPTFNDADGISNEFYKVAKRYFFTGKGGWNGYSNGSNTSDAASSQFSYKTAVAFQPKDRDDPIYKKLKTNLESPTGEDNYFIRLNSPGDVYAGVADGVGGWAEHGYDSSAISRELCNAMNVFSSTAYSNDHKGLTPKGLIELSYKKIKQENIVKVGGTTAIAAHFPPNGAMTIANLGDSWCGVFRDSKLIFQTEFQTVGFNAPYQLSIIPDEMLKKAERSGSSYIQNTPSDADEYLFQLAKNDIVVLATDGVTDNVAYEDMELFLKNHESQSSQDLQSITQEFVKKVVKLSKDPNYPSVFAQEISKLTGKQYQGGKEDDITVVFVKVE